MRQNRGTRPIRAAVLPVVAALVLSPFTPGQAAVSTDDLTDHKNAVDQDIAALQEALSDTTGELQTVYRRYSATAAALRQARARLKSDRAAEARAKRENAELSTRLAAAEAAQKAVQQQLAAGQAAIEQTQRETGGFAAQVYRRGGVLPQLELVLGSSDPEDFAERSAMVDLVLRHQQDSLRSLQRRKAANLVLADRANDVQHQVSALASQAGLAYRRATAARVAAAKQAAKVATTYRAQVAAVAAVKARKGQENARMATLRRQQKALQATLAERAERRRRAAGGGDGVVGPTTGIMTVPVPGASVTSTFGWRMHPIYHTRRLHEGMDFGAACGSPVHAAADGDVVNAGVVGGYGNQIIVDHGLHNGRDVTTTYNHLTSFVVRSGHVARGQLIAYSGTTGSSTGCHLHFEVRLNGAPVDPAPYL